MFITAIGGHRLRRHRMLSCVTAIGGHRVHRHRGHRASLLSEVIVCIVIKVIVRHCHRRSSCASSSRSSCVTAIEGHRVCVIEVIVRYCYRRSSFVNAIVGYRSSLQSEVIVFIVIEVIVHQCKRGHYSSLQSEVIVSSSSQCASLPSEVVVRQCYQRSSCVTAIGGHRVYRHRGHRCHYNRRSSCASMASLSSLSGSKFIVVMVVS